MYGNAAQVKCEFLLVYSALARNHVVRCPFTQRRLGHVATAALDGPKPFATTGTSHQGPDAEDSDLDYAPSTSSESEDDLDALSGSTATVSSTSSGLKAIAKKTKRGIPGKNPQRTKSFYATAVQALRMWCRQRDVPAGHSPRFLLSDKSLKQPARYQKLDSLNTIREITRST